MSILKNGRDMAAAVALSAAAFASCGALEGLSPVHRLCIRLPERPDSWSCLPELRIALSWRDADGRTRSLSLAPGVSAEIEVERGRPQVIFALPSSRGRGLKPAGALYPEALTVGAATERSASSGDEIALDWIGGYVASVAYALEREGLDPRAYALDRLAREISTRSSDPWLLSADETARRLSAHSLRASDFDEPRRYQVLMPAPGPWAPESPFGEEPKPCLDEGPDCWKAELPAGLWRFIGAENELFIEVDSEGVHGWALR
jgi:hypothetical protein